MEIIEGLLYNKSCMKVSAQARSRSVQNVAVTKIFSAELILEKIKCRRFCKGLSQENFYTRLIISEGICNEHNRTQAI